MSGASKQRGRLVLAVAAGAVVVGAIWFLVAPPSGRGASASKSAGRGGGSRRLLGGGGVSELAANSARDQVGGTVYDDDGIPVESGTVILSCLDGRGEPGGFIPGGVAKLSEDGTFVAPGCGGTVCAQLQHPTLLQSEAWVLEPGINEELGARPLERLRGRVRTVDGEGVASARLVLLPTPEDDDPRAVSPFVSRKTSTDVDGSFFFAKIERPPCDPCGEVQGRCEPGAPAEIPSYAEMLLTARAPGHALAEMRIDTDRSNDLVVVLPDPGEPLIGTIVGPDDRGYRRARVLAVGTGDRRYDKHGAEPDTEGAFSLDELAAQGRYDLRVLQDGVEVAQASDVGAGDNLSLVGKWDAVGVRVEVTVRDRDGRALTDAIVSGGPFEGAHADRAGRVAQDGVLPSEYGLAVRAGGEPKRVTITVEDSGEDQEFEVVLEGT